MSLEASSHQRVFHDFAIVRDDLGSEGKAGALISTLANFSPRRAVKANDNGSLLYNGESKYNKFKAMGTKRLQLLVGYVFAMSVIGLLSYPSMSGKLHLPHNAAGENSASVSSRFLALTIENARRVLVDRVQPRCTKSVESARVEIGTRGLSNIDSAVEDCYEAQWAPILGLIPSKGCGGGLMIGLVGIDEQEEDEFTLESATFHVYPFERSQLQWSDLFPEWIDEDAYPRAYPPPECPHVPMPTVDNHEPGEAPILLDAVAIKVQSCGGRDVLRLQTLLAGATVASEAGRSASGSIWVVFISPCRPYVNLFPCSELVEQQDDLWLFQVNLRRLRRVLDMPVGSCELAISLDNNAAVASSQMPDVRDGAHSKATASRPRREAYATMLHTNGGYVCGAIVTAQSIRATGSQRDLIALVDENITPKMREGLQQSGWQLQVLERIGNPRASAEAYNKWNYSKFRLWQLTQYDKVIFIDADLLVLRNLDFLFDMPEISAAGNDAFLFNSGLMVLEPSNCTFHHLNEVESYNEGDQGYLNEIFPWWHRFPKRLNFLKFYYPNATEEHKKIDRLFEARDPSLYVIHYLGWKPWVCDREHDCNWNQEDHHVYASDAAHKQWWDVHDSMPLHCRSIVCYQLQQ